MKDNKKPDSLAVEVNDLANDAVNSLAEFCIKLHRERGMPAPLILYALDVNHGMCQRQILDASFAAMRAESSEGPQGG